MARPDVFNVLLEKQSYIAGEIVRGKVQLKTSQPIKCRSVKFRIAGEGFSYFWYTRGSGDDKRWEKATNRKRYFNETHTLWGPFYRTEAIDSAGTNAVFGSPLSPNEGVLLIPCADPNVPLILRVMDEDWGTRDDVCGEVLLPSAQALVEQAAKGEVTFELFFKGEEGAGTVTLLASWQDALESGAPPLLRLTTLRVLGLRNAEGWFANALGAKNDVYIQVYPPPPGSDVQPGDTMPPPISEAVLPPGDYEFELPALKLPDRAPPSYEVERCRNPVWRTHHYKHAHMRYYVEASIDIKWGFDPYVRLPISVAGRMPSGLFVTPLHTGPLSKEIFPDCCGCCELECLSSEGSVALEASLSRNGGAPGEWLTLSGTFTNSLNGKHADVVVRLVCSSLLRAERRTRFVEHDVEMVRIRIETGAPPLELNEYPFQLPICPTSYHGGALRDEAWEAVMKEHEMHVGWDWWCVDPVVWWYTIVVELDVPDTSFDLRKEFSFTMASVPQLIPFVIPAEVIAAAAPVATAAAAIEGKAAGDDDDDSVGPPLVIPSAMVTAVPIDAMYQDGDVAEATLADGMVWGTPAGLKEGVEHRMDYDDKQAVALPNAIGATNYTPVYPVAVQARPAEAGEPAAVVNLALPKEAGTPEVEAPKQMEMPHASAREEGA